MGKTYRNASKYLSPKTSYKSGHKKENEAQEYFRQQSIKRLAREMRESIDKP